MSRSVVNQPSGSIDPVLDSPGDKAAIFHVESRGRLANRMIQYMVALTFAARVPGCRISNVDLPEWGIHLPPLPHDGPSLVWDEAHHLDIDEIRRRSQAAGIGRVRYQGFGQRMENFLDSAQYRDVFQSPRHQGVGYGAGDLLCHVRAGDVLGAPHPGYVLTPVAFYQEIVARTGLRPVFMGETEAGPYMNRLRAAFPGALVLPKGDIIQDFETIRQSRTIVVSCSTFCWLAAWLSDAERIFMPVNGLLNPRQDRRIDLLPFDDARYSFSLFPINHAVPEARHAARHRMLAGMWRDMPHATLRRIVTGAPRVPVAIDRFVDLFDGRFYDTQVPAAGRDPADGLAHYRTRGFAEGLACFALDEAWYAESYPMAAFEVAQGDYLDFWHHYADIGRARGYLPVPPGLTRWRTVAAARLRRLAAGTRRRLGAA